MLNQSPGSLIRIPYALSYSTSLDALDRSASLSFSRIIRNPSFLFPSGVQRGTTKQEGGDDSLTFASVRNISDYFKKNQKI